MALDFGVREREREREREYHFWNAPGCIKIKKQSKSGNMGLQPDSKYKEGKNKYWGKAKQG